MKCVITDKKDIEKFCRESTLKELKTIVVITLGRVKTKEKLGIFLKDFGDSILRRGK